MTVLAAEPYAWVVLEAHPHSLPGGSWAALVASLWPVFFAWPLAISFVFPDGRLPSRRWRPYATFAVGSMTLLVVLLVMSEKLESPFEDVANPSPVRWPDALGFLRGPAWLGVFASLFLGAAAVRTRYRRSTGIERLQMLWLAYAALLVPLGVVCFLVWGFVLGEPGDAVLAVLLATQAAVALAVGVAVTRYRLYEIDRLINRTLVYSAVTASLAPLYAAVSLLAGVAVGRGSTWVAALSAVGRHAHIDDREVGLVLGDDDEKRVGVADPRDDLVAGVLGRPARPSRRRTASSAITIRMESPPRADEQVHRDDRRRLIPACFLLFLAKLRSRLLAAEGGIGELTSLVVASGAVFVAMLLVAAASRGVVGFAIKSPGDNESLPGADTLRYLPQTGYAALGIGGLLAAAVAMATTSWLIVRTAAFGRWLAWLGSATALVIVVAAAALVGMVAIPAMLFWVLAVSVAMWRGQR